MAMDVVDLLETVEIEQEHAVRRARPGRRRDRRLERVVELAPVGQASQDVLIG